MHRDRPPLLSIKNSDGSALTQALHGPSLPLVAQRFQSRAPLPILRPNQSQRGTLSHTDTFDPNFPKRFSDNYLIQGVRPEQQVRIKVTSSDFDTFIQLVDAQTDELILVNDDNGRNQNSRLSFVLQPGTTYHLRVSSYARRKTGNYTVKMQAHTASIQDFSFAYGHGMVDAAAAVTAAIALNAPLNDLSLGQGGQGEQNYSVSDLVNYSSDPTEVSDSTEVDGQLTHSSWNLRRVNAPKVWQQGSRGEGVVVAVVDSGVSLNHPDLNLWRNPGEIPGNNLDDDGNGFVDDVRGWDFIKNNNNPKDREIHGTHVAGIVGAKQNNIGITGVAPEATIMPVRVLDRNGRGTSEGVAQGIRYAVRNGADVINLSLGAPPGGRPGRSLRRALQFAHRKGVVVVIAAGNERVRLGTSRPGEPAFWAATRNLAIAVGAVSQQRAVASFSNPTGNRRVNPFVVAPGVNIGCLAAVWLRNAFGPENVEAVEPLFLSGTSMATPHVAGLVALMLSANPTLTPKQVNQIVSDTANPDNLTAI